MAKGGRAIFWGQESTFFVQFAILGLICQRFFKSRGGGWVGGWWVPAEHPPGGMPILAGTLLEAGFCSVFAFCAGKFLDPKIDPRKVGPPGPPSPGGWVGGWSSLFLCGLIMAVSILQNMQRDQVGGVGKWFGLERLGPFRPSNSTLLPQSMDENHILSVEDSRLGLPRQLRFLH